MSRGKVPVPPPPHQNVLKSPRGRRRSRGRAAWPRAVLNNERARRYQDAARQYYIGRQGETVGWVLSPRVPEHTKQKGRPANSSAVSSLSSRGHGVARVLAHIDKAAHRRIFSIVSALTSTTASSPDSITKSMASDGVHMACRSVTQQLRCSLKLEKAAVPDVGAGLRRCAKRAMSKTLATIHPANSRTEGAWRRGWPSITLRQLQRQCRFFAAAALAAVFRGTRLHFVVHCEPRAAGCVFCPGKARC